MSEHEPRFVETTDSLLDERSEIKDVEESASIESYSSIDKQIEEIEEGIDIVIDSIQEMYDRHGCNIL